MKKGKLKKLILSIVLLIWLLSFPVINDMKKISTKVNQPTSSDGEIILVTPENRTYSTAMSGYYPATYGFENDTTGEFPSGWYDKNEAGISADIVEEFNGHKKVLRIDDQSSNWGHVQQNFTSSQNPEIIEFWYYPDKESFTTVNLWSETAEWTDFFYMQFLHDNDHIRYYDGEFHDIYRHYEEQWYHFRYEIDYASDKIDISIDGVKYVEGANFRNPADECTGISFQTWSSTTGIVYIDAIGVSFDEEYSIGDNMQEGFLLGYNNYTSLDWTGYSIDGDVNRTLMGNYTIPVPDKGLHTIQVFGNDSLGVMYSTDLTYFTMDHTDIPLSLPQNQTYFNPMSGYYPATLGFENDLDGSVAEKWINNSQTGCSASIINEYQNHSKVLYLDGRNPGVADIEHSFPGVISGTVEFWINTANNQERNYVLLKDSTQPDLAFYIAIDNGDLKFGYGAGPTYINIEIENNEWHHIRFSFDCNTRKVSFWFDNTEYLTNGDFFETSTNYIDLMRIHTNSIESNAHFYIDAIGFSWKPGYSIGDNRNEGILLGFDDSNLDSMEYSLNGQEKIPILGNTTLTADIDGNHTIQVFGKDLSGNLYESEDRFFEINFAPIIKWITPRENELVVLPTGDAIFEFQYSCRKVFDVYLEINGTDFGSVWEMDSTILEPYTSEIDGPVTAVLIGKDETNVTVVTDSINITFAKLDFEVIELLDSGSEFLGKKLYLILHDPAGDNSYSGFSQTTTQSISTKSSFSQTYGLELGIGDMEEESGFSTKIEGRWASEEEYEMVITDSTELTSSLDSSDSDYIGPGYGDRYWGEAVTYVWKLKASHRIYFNGTERYETPRIYWGLIRENEVILNDYNAPQEWRDLNPVHNGWQNVDWLTDFTFVGGQSYSVTHKVQESTKRTDSFAFSLDASVGTNLPWLSLQVSMNLEWQNHQTTGSTEEVETKFVIYDDESTDVISQEYGTDKTFGTVIFRTVPIICQTSQPLEHGTFDYVPPVVEFPDINLDSSQDGIGPCQDDLPLVLAEISDEGGIQEAIIKYSINQGTSWEFTNLTEQAANPGKWQGKIPAFSHGTIIQWYVVAWDNEGSNTTRLDPNENPYTYMVINRAPSILVLNPNGGETFDDTINLEWSASDPDGDGLTFTIAYNMAGTGWTLIATGLTENSYEWDPGDLSYTDKMLIKIIVSDGYGGSAEDISDYVFTIEGIPLATGLGTFEIGMLVGTVVSAASAIGALSMLIVSKRKVPT